MLDSETVDKPNVPLSRTAWLTIPNLLSLFRIAAAPGLIVLAMAGFSGAFLTLFLVSTLTDAVDGTIARWLGQESEWGAYLDTSSDTITWIATPMALYYLVPDRILPEIPLFLAAGLVLIISAAVSFIKYRRVAVYHSLASKVAAILLSIGTVTLVVIDWALPFRLGAAALLITAIEELFMTRILPTCHTNIPTAWHARRIARSGESPR